MRYAAAILLALALAAPAQAQPAAQYHLEGLSVRDLLVLGRGLDKLLGADPLDRAYTDPEKLYDRIQAQINQQYQAAAKAQADAAKAATDKAIADAVEAVKAESKKPKAEEEPNP